MHFTTNSVIKRPASHLQDIDLEFSGTIYYINIDIHNHAKFLEVTMSIIINKNQTYLQIGQVVLNLFSDFVPPN